MHERPRIQFAKVSQGAAQYPCVPHTSPSPGQSSALTQGGRLSGSSTTPVPPPAVVPVGSVVSDVVPSSSTPSSEELSSSPADVPLDSVGSNPVVPAVVEVELAPVVPSVSALVEDPVVPAVLDVAPVELVVGDVPDDDDVVAVATHVS